MTDSATPLDRLLALVATDRCTLCERFTPLDYADLAAHLGVSETTVRKLADPGYMPSWPLLGKMAATLGTSPLTLAAHLWPGLAEEPSATPKVCPACGAGPGQTHANDCTTQQGPWTENG